MRTVSRKLANESLWSAAGVVDGSAKSSSVPHAMEKTERIDMLKG
jgi:hypothetical protein